MKFFTLALLVAAPFVSAISARDDVPSTVNPSTDGLVPLTQENAAARFPELAGVQARDTNARRLAEGLPLLAPHPTRKHHSPTHAHAARSSPFPVAGAISALGENGEDLGWVGHAPNAWGEYGATKDASEVLQFSTHLTGVDSTPVDITISNPVLPAFSFLGLTVGYGNTGTVTDLGPGSSNYLTVTGMSSSTGADAQPQNPPNTFTATTNVARSSESAVWSWVADTNDVYPHWTNSDGSHPAVLLAYYRPQNFFFVTGDMDAFKSAFGGDVTAVHFGITGVPS